MGFFSVTLQPFSVRMFSFMGGVSTMASSITVYLTWPIISALLLAPLALLFMPWLTRKLPWFRSGAPLGKVGWALGLLLVAAYALVSQAYVKANWSNSQRWETRIAINPHTEMLLSMVDDWTNGDALVFHPAHVDLRDFESRRRPKGSPAALNLPGMALAGPRPKNVVVLFLESMAAEYLSVYGSKYNTTPNLKRLAEERGVVFENFYVSVPYSCKSLVAMTSSVYPRIDWQLIVSDFQDFDVPTVTQTLAPHGYRSCFAHSGYWDWRDRYKYLKPRVGDLIDAKHLSEARISSWGVADRAMFQASLDWIDAEPTKPFYLLAYTIETHHPYATPEAPLTFKVEDKEFADYLNAVRATDEHIGWLVQELDKRGVLDETLIVITSDHGEAFGQHNQRAHNYGVYECNTHIPLIMLHPSLKNYPRRIPGVREQIDLSPTILDLLGVKSPALWQGRNLFRTDDGRPAYFFCVGNYVVLGLRDGKYKYHYYVGGGQEELFNLEVDPGENHNLASANPERCQDYRQRVGGLVRYQREFLKQHGSP